MLIARLIADAGSLSANLARATVEIEAAGMRVAQAAMDDFCGDALQLSLPEGDAARLRAIVDAHFAPADLLISEREPGVPSLLVSDMDSTMIGQECIDELADFAGLKPQIAAITERAMKGELDFPSALRERVALLAGLGEDAVARCLAERITPMAGARTLVATLKSLGTHCVLVTGGFHQFADPVAEMLGFERVVGNTLEVAGGQLTGGLIGAISDSATKHAALEQEMARLGEGATSLALGDGANDIPMIAAATWGVAYHAKPKARGAAAGAIDRGDLTSVLKLLGIAQERWVTG